MGKSDLGRGWTFLERMEDEFAMLPLVATYFRHDTPIEDEHAVVLTLHVFIDD